jgi:hypothetical protein
MGACFLPTIHRHHRDRDRDRDRPLAHAAPESDATNVSNAVHGTRRLRPIFTEVNRPVLISFHTTVWPRLRCAAASGMLSSNFAGCCGIIPEVMDLVARCCFGFNGSLPLLNAYWHDHMTVFYFQTYHTARRLHVMSADKFRFHFHFLRRSFSHCSQLAVLHFHCAYQRLSASISVSLRLSMRQAAFLAFAPGWVVKRERTFVPIRLLFTQTQPSKSTAERPASAPGRSPLAIWLSSLDGDGGPLPQPRPLGRWRCVRSLRDAAPPLAHVRFSPHYGSRVCLRGLRA